MRRMGWRCCCAALLIAVAAMFLLNGNMPLADDAWDEAQLQQMSADELKALRSRIDDRLRALGEYPFVKLAEGSKGDEVSALQWRLKELGYFPQDVDGRYRTTTVNAMKAFEKAMGLKRDGTASIEDQIALFASTAQAAPTPTPSPTPKPTRTPSLAKDYGRLDYRLAGLMPEKYAGTRYKFSGDLIAAEGQRWLVQLDDESVGLVMVQNPTPGRNPGDNVTVWGLYIGLTSYESQSGTVTLPLFSCEHAE